MVQQSGMWRQGAGEGKGQCAHGPYSCRGDRGVSVSRASTPNSVIEERAATLSDAQLSSVLKYNSKV